MQHNPSSVNTVLNSSMHRSVFVANLQYMSISSHGCDVCLKYMYRKNGIICVRQSKPRITSKRNRLNSDHLPEKFVGIATVSAPNSSSCWHKLSTNACSTVFGGMFSTIVLRAMFILQMVTAGNGMSAIDVATAFNPMMMGDALHFW